MISSLINIRSLTSDDLCSLSLLDRYKAVFRSMMLPVNCGLNLVRLFVIGVIIICTVYATVNEVNNCLSNTVSTVKFGAKFAARLNFSLFKLGCLCVFAYVCVCVCVCLCSSLYVIFVELILYRFHNWTLRC